MFDSLRHMFAAMGLSVFPDVSTVESTVEAEVLDPRTTAERATREVVAQQSEQFTRMADFCSLLDAVPSVLLVLNRYRQVIYANRALRDLLDLDSVERTFGQRPGEILECDHAFESCGGCGVSEACKTCGTAKAIASCERGAAAVRECRIISRRGNALDLRISTTPFRLDGQTYTVVSLTDISHEKRREALERIFFHDLLNTAGAITGYAELLQAAPGEAANVSGSIHRLASTIAEEIRAQRELAAAENHDLQVQWGPARTLPMIQQVVETYRNHEAIRERALAIDPAAADITFVSDERLLIRVLGNMVKNALEATRSGDQVTIGCSADNDRVDFWVNNPGTMPRDVQLQVFQRSFSTKGAGRGLGTYSIRLLTEQYLRGRVSFTTSLDAGTTFRVSYPRRP